MDIEKLIERLNELYWSLRLDGEQQCSPEINTVAFGLMDAATALSTLQAENEKLREKIEDARLEGYAKGLGEMSAELEQVIAERGALIEDFVDYVTDGVPNPAIFCKNRCNKCVDMRGWCTGKNCKGFYPSVASGPKED